MERYGDLAFRVLPEYLSAMTGISPDRIAFYMLAGEVWLGLALMVVGVYIKTAKPRIHK